MTTPDPYSAGYDRVEMCAYGDCQQPASYGVEAYFFGDRGCELRTEPDDMCPTICRAHRAPYAAQNFVVTVRSTPEPHVQIEGVRFIPLHTPNPQPTVRRLHW